MSLLHRLSVAFAAAAVGLACAASAVAATPTCAFANQTPCLAKHTAAFSFCGKIANDAATSLDLTIEGTSATGKLKAALAEYICNDVTVRDAYDQATVYVTRAKPYGSDTWDSDPARFTAKNVTADISDLTVGPDLGGAWSMSNGPSTLTAEDSSNRVYDGVGTSGETFVLTLTSATRACITNYVNPAGDATFGCGRISADLQTIGPIAWTSSV